MAAAHELFHLLFVQWLEEVMAAKYLLMYAVQRHDGHPDPKVWPSQQALLDPI
jgi:hypothetical protein